MQELNLHDVLSGVSGSVSLACWMFLLVPQLIENFRLKSAEGVSLTFLFIWVIGDVTNLLGSIFASLIPTVIALAIYFVIADAVLISQCLFYRRISSRIVTRCQPKEVEDEAQQPLLGNRRNSVGAQSPGLVSVEAGIKAQNPGSTMTPVNSKAQDGHVIRAWIWNTTVILAIVAVGVVGWAIASRAGLLVPARLDGQEPGSSQPLGAMLLGYASAVSYLGARLPQIVKNYRDESCEGLSLLFFLLSLLGNLTYGGSILFNSVERGYLLTNLPWLLGSLGTMIEDVTIFFQFQRYAKPKTNRAEPTAL